MDVLLVIDAAEVPERLSARARRRVDVAYGPLPPEIIADLRAHIPRSVGLVAPDSDQGRGWLHKSRRPAAPGRPAGRGAERRPRRGRSGHRGQPDQRSGSGDPGGRLVVGPGRQHPPRPARPDRAEPSWPVAGQAGVPQPRWQRQGPARARHGRGGRTRRAAQAGRNHRRADVWQHRRRSGHRRRPPRLPLHLHDARQDRRGEGRAPPRLWRRGGGLPDGGRPGPPRLLLLGRPAAGRDHAGCLPARPVLQPPQPRSALPDHRAGDLAGRPPAASPT